MDLKEVIFPSPHFNYITITNFKEDLILIPKEKENVSITTEQDKFIPCLLLLDTSRDKSNNFILFFHGNAEDIFGAWTVADKIRQKLCINVLIVEYPGYSLYKEDKNSDSVLEDSLYVYDYIKANFPNVNHENIFVFGRSIGTSPAIYLSSKRKPAALFVVSAFTSIKAVASNLAGFLSLFIKNRFNSIDFIKDITCPMLLIHGQKDTLIPCSETEKLKCNCNCPFEVRFPDDMTHNDFDLETDIINPIQQFIYKNCGPLESTSQAIIPPFLYTIPMFIQEKIKASNKNDKRIIDEKQKIDDL